MVRTLVEEKAVCFKTPLIAECSKRSKQKWQAAVESVKGVNQVSKQVKKLGAKAGNELLSNLFRSSSEQFGRKVSFIPRTGAMTHPEDRSNGNSNSLNVALVGI
jgi:hypothetical protein